jgi:molybdate transport repressor ModE-like protein
LPPELVFRRTVLLFRAMRTGRPKRTGSAPARPTSHATDGTAALQSAHENIIAAQVKTKVWIGWSYRHAWGYLRRAETALKTPIVRNRPGRGAARGTELTETGLLLLERLRSLRDRIDDALGPSGPTLAEVAARGNRAGRGPHIPTTAKVRPRRKTR